jgi:uncharacterized coiled-coil DUF342 family protein
MATTHEQPQSRPTSSPTPASPFTESRDLYRQKYEAQLREWEAKVEEMRARADKLDAQARLSMRPHFDGIENSMKAAQAKLRDIGESAEDKWEEIKRNADTAWNDFKAAVEGAYDAFRGQGRSKGGRN